MPTRFDLYRRLEPAQPYQDLGLGFRAEVHDAAWFLARQWLMGEHQGENASSPVRVSHETTEIPIESFDGNIDYNPATTPPEAVVESEHEDWWTPGRRIRIGLAARALVRNLENAHKFLLDDLPAPYQRLNGRGFFDGLKIYRSDSENPIFDEVPTQEPIDLWNPAEFHYTAKFKIGERELHMPSHSGGRVDWYSVDADGPLPSPEAIQVSDEIYASRLRYPGAPCPRWWEIEDAHVDIGGFAPDRAHFGTMLLVDLVVSHSDDWYLLPIVAKVGNIVTLERVHVLDSFDEKWTLTAPENWSLFQVKKLASNSLAVWPTVTIPLRGSVIEEVLLGIDEDANLLTAVERRVDGRDLETLAVDPPESSDSEVIDASAPKSYRYSPSTQPPTYHYPYVLKEIDDKRNFVQARFADLSEAEPEFAPEPQGKLLRDSVASENDPFHKIDPTAIPPNGVCIERRRILARRTDGTPVLWMQRKRKPLLAPPTIGLQYDIAEQEQQ